MSKCEHDKNNFTVEPWCPDPQAEQLPLHHSPPFVHFSPEEEAASPGANWCQSSSEQRQKPVTRVTHQSVLEPARPEEASEVKQEQRM